MDKKPRKKKTVLNIENNTTANPSISSIPSSSIKPKDYPNADELVKKIKQNIDEMIKKDIQIKANENRNIYLPLENHILEFMKSFILVGYSVNGERTVVGYVKNQQDKDALTEQFRNIFMKMMLDSM